MLRPAQHDTLDDWDKGMNGSMPYIAPFSLKQKSPQEPKFPRAWGGGR